MTGWFPFIFFPMRYHTFGWSVIHDFIPYFHSKLQNLTKLKLWKLSSNQMIDSILHVSSRTSQIGPKIFQCEARTSLSASASQCFPHIFLPGNHWDTPHGNKSLLRHLQHMMPAVGRDRAFYIKVHFWSAYYNILVLLYSAAIYQITFTE